MTHDDFKLTKNTYERRAHEVVRNKPMTNDEDTNNDIEKIKRAIVLLYAQIGHANEQAERMELFEIIGDFTTSKTNNYENK